MQNFNDLHKSTHREYALIRYSDEAGFNFYIYIFV